MISSKKKKVLKYIGNLYVKKAFPFTHTNNIDEATNYYPFHEFFRAFIYWIYKIKVKPINLLSVKANFDSRMEVETGGVKGWWNKLLLKIVRYLDEKRSI